jgi:hypothetical protein
MKIDIERLHRVIEYIETGQSLPRGAGQTTAMLMLLIGNIEVSPPCSTFVVVCHNAQHRTPLMYRFLELAQAAGLRLQIRHTNSVLVTNGTHILFTTPSSIMDGSIRGIEITNYFIDDLPMFVSDNYTGEFEEILLKLELQTKLRR